MFAILKNNPKYIYLNSYFLNNSIIHKSKANHFFKVETALTAASSKFYATKIFKFLFFAEKSDNILFPLSAFVPVNLQTNGSFKSTNSAALIIPSAITSHFMIPPKILIKIVSTLGCELKI
jgi:hypothetical protein